MAGDYILVLGAHKEAKVQGAGGSLALRDRLLILGSGSPDQFLCAFQTCIPKIFHSMPNPQQGKNEIIQVFEKGRNRNGSSDCLRVRLFFLLLLFLGPLAETLDPREPRC